MNHEEIDLNETYKSRKLEKSQGVKQVKEGYLQTLLYKHRYHFIVANDFKKVIRNFDG